MRRFRLRGRRHRNRTPRPDLVPLRAMVPNLITSMAACGGITSIAICATNYAKALAGHKEGDTVRVAVDEPYKVKILAVK